jgi:1-acylglycerone phosphate reductase
MPVIDSDLYAAREMFDVNVFALVGTTKAFAPLLLASKGVIVNIGSMLGFAPFPYQGLYNASKAAVHILTDNLRIELEPFGVRVVLVSFQHKFSLLHLLGLLKCDF